MADPTLEIKTFRDLPEKVDFKSGSWSFGRYNYGEWCISYVDNQLNQTDYKLPYYMGEMLEQQFKQGQEDAQRKIRMALGL